MIFRDTDSFIQIRIFAPYPNRFFNIFFNNLRILQRHLRAGFIRMNQAGHTQQRSAEIAHHHHQNIRQFKRINLPQNRPARTSGRFSVIIGAKLIAVHAKPVRITPMPRLVMFLSQIINMFFHLFRRLHGICERQKSAAFIFKFCLSRRFQSSICCDLIHV